MIIERINVTVGEVCEGYYNDAEEGVTGYNEMLDIRPKYQREFVYKDEQRNEVIRTVMKGLPLNVIYWCKIKEVNDTYGHEYGDEVLFNIAQIMEASLTDGEIFGRYGGEEFVILFPGKTPAEALPTVRALGDHVRTHGWSHGKPVTLSGGLSSYVKGISYSNFVEAADKNLYIAKREGRDRIIYR
jgi:diguanylate cyclase (GGDEF)-like protein